MKISRFAFSNKEKKHRETCPTGNRRSYLVYQHFRRPNRCSCRWNAQLQRGLQTVVVGALRKTNTAERVLPGSPGCSIVPIYAYAAPPFITMALPLGCATGSAGGACHSTVAAPIPDAVPGFLCIPHIRSNRT